MWSGERKFRIEDALRVCFVCPSLKEILKIFGENIIKLKARGGKQMNSPETDKSKLRTLGIKFLKINDTSCIINYDKGYRQISKHDDLNKRNIKIILKDLDKYGIKDCAVEYLKLRIVDSELRDIIKELFPQLESNVFLFEFKLLMCENEVDKDVWEKTDYNKDVLAPLKFKRSMLHCFKLIDEENYIQTKRNKQEFYIDWKPTKKSLKLPYSPRLIAKGVIHNLEPYGYTKKYSYSKDKKLKLVKMS